MTGNNTTQGTGAGASGTDGARESPRLLPDLYLSILREAPDGVVLVDSEGECRYLNPAFTRITGYTREDVPGLQAWFERAHPNPAYRQSVEAMGQKLLRGEQSALVASAVCKDGRVRDLELRRAPVEGGLAMLVVRDVTKQALIEECLRQTASELTAVIEAFPDQFLRLNADGTVLEFRVGKLAEVPIVPLALLGRRVQDLFPAEIGGALGEALQQAVRTGAPAAPLEFSHAIAGAIRYYETRVVPLREMQAIAVIREITERKEAEQELHRHREHLEDLVRERTAQLEHTNQRLERLLYAIEMTERKAVEEWLDSSIEQGTLEVTGPEEGRITTDHTGTVIIVDRVAERLTGYAEEELAGKPIWSLFSSAAIRETLTSEVLGEGRPVERREETMHTRDDGSRQPVSIVADPIVDAAGVVIGMLCTFRKA